MILAYRSFSLNSRKSFSLLGSWRDIRPLQLRCFLITTLLRWDRERGLPGSQRTAGFIQTNMFICLPIKTGHASHLWSWECEATPCVPAGSWSACCREKPDRCSRGGSTRLGPPGSGARRRWPTHRTAQKQHSRLRQAVLLFRPKRRRSVSQKRTFSDT